MMAETSERAPCTAMPTTRKGNSTSHTTGYSTRAIKANGHENINKRHQSRKVSM